MSSGGTRQLQLQLQDAPTPARDFQGVWGAIVLSFALVPFQGWAAFKGLVSKDEGPWFRTPKTGRVTDEVHHLRRLNLLRRILLGPRAWRQESRPRASQPSPMVGRRPGRPLRRWVGWAVAVALLLAFGGLAWLSSRAPVVDAAGNPLYLHGTGTSPACAASTIDQVLGTRTTPCRIQSSAGGVTSTWGFTNLPAQTVASGVWTFTMNWTGGNGNTNDTVTIRAGFSVTSSCAGFVATIPNAGTTWSTTYGLSGAHTTSPFTVSTSASQASMAIPAGGSLCLQVTLTHTSGGKPSMAYDGKAGVGDTRVVPPSIVVPESLLGFAGLALVIPVFTGRRRWLAFFKVRR